MTRRAVIADRVLTAAGVVGDAVVVDDSRIVEVTSRDRLGDLPASRFPGSTVVPAMIDSHIHPLGYAALVTGTSLKDAAGIDDLVKRLADVVARTPSQAAVVAQRFDDTVLGSMPTRADLDRASEYLPLLIYRYCGHVAVGNTAALELAGIGPDTPDPPGGSLDRDPEGRPNGVLRETAVELVSEHIDALVTPPSDEAVITAFAGLVSAGLHRVTAIVAAGEPLWCGVGAELETLCRVANDLPLPVDVLVIADETSVLADSARRVETAGGKLRFWGWKGFADGSLGGHTAAMWAPFSDRPTRGTLRLDPNQAETMARAALGLGGVAAIHAIGDRAVDEVLDVYDRLLATGSNPSRLRIEHVSVVADAAISRLANTGIIASIQPAFVASEAGWAPARLGPERPAYRFGTMASAGVRMIGGSDCPVERPDPLHGIMAATTRPGWTDAEQMDTHSALDLFTGSPADLLGLPRPLAEGSPADFVLVLGDPGDEAAAVAAVYRDGIEVDLAPLTWPG